MTDESPEVLAHRAATQASHAAKNGGRAVEEAAHEAVDKIEDHAPSAEQVRDATKKLALMSGELGWAFVGLSATAYAATFTLRKFQQAWNSR